MYMYICHEFLFLYSLRGTHQRRQTRNRNVLKTKFVSLQSFKERYMENGLHCCIKYLFEPQIPHPSSHPHNDA